MKHIYLATAMATLASGAVCAAAEEPYTKPDGSWVSLNGTVVTRPAQEAVTRW